MSILQNYNKNIVKYDSINKFNVKKIQNLPSLQFVTLNFNLKKNDSSLLLIAMSALKLLTFQNGIVITSKISNVSIKIRKGQPIGCKIRLRKTKMNNFLFSLINKILINKPLPKSKIFTVFSFKITNMFMFNSLEQNYKYFKNISNLTVDVTTTQCTLNEFKFLLKSYKLST